MNRTESNKFSFCTVSLYHSNDLEFICNPLDDDDNTIEIIEYPRNIITHHIHATPPKTEAITSYGMVMSIAVIHASILLVAYESGYVVVFHQFKVASFIKVTDHLICMAAGSDRQVIVGTPGNELVVLRLVGDGGPRLVEDRRVTLANAGVGAIGFRGDRLIFATAGWDGLVRVFSCRSCKQLAALRWDIGALGGKKNGGQLAVCFSDDDFLVTGSDDKIICLWDVFRDR